MDWHKVIFLAHAKEDSEKIKVIFSELKKLELIPWFDENSLTPGAIWEDKIKEAIVKSKFFIAFFSKTSIQKSGYVQKELKLALSELEKKPPDNTYFIPVLLEDIELPNLSVGTINLKDFHAVKIYKNEEKQRLYNYLTESVLNKKIDIYQEELNSITDYLLEGKIEKALEELIAQTKLRNSNYWNNAILLMSQFKRLKVEYISNTIHSSDYNVNVNRISFAVLEIIELIEKEVT